MEKPVCLLTLIFFSFSVLCSAAADSPRENGVCSWSVVKAASDSTDFKCLNGRIIDRLSYCDGFDDCGDNSDESCSCFRNCPYDKVRCDSTTKAIPNTWRCDGFDDCPDGSDEINCKTKKEKDRFSLVKALYWLTRVKWGSAVDKCAVAIYLASDITSHARRAQMNEMAYETSIQLLSKLTGRNLQDIPSTDLASYVNAFLVTCVDPRKFYGMDLVQELRSRVDRQNYTNPYVFLSLCNAGETMKESDVKKLTEIFWNKKRTFWTDIQAVVVMALACARQQPASNVNHETFGSLVMELKQRQYRNGTVENLQTTALVMQAMLSAEPSSDPDNFDEAKAVQQMLSMQKSDGSFGNLMNTYYVLPVLNCKSLVNISSEHCEQYPRYEMSSLQQLTNRSGPKIHVRYSIWIEKEKDLERTLNLRVPTNVSFYGVMEMAADTDSRFRFEYTVQNRKPYVNALSGLQNDPERGKFWFLYTVHEGIPTPSAESPADVMPKEKEHFVMWYRTGSWQE